MTTYIILFIKLIPSVRAAPVHSGMTTASPDEQPANAQSSSSPEEMKSEEAAQISLEEKKER